MLEDGGNFRLAVLIDADNVPRDCLKNVMEEIAVYGNPTVKRIYGDWTIPNVSGWKQSLLENAVTPIQQYSYTTGKNATDSAMIIDAMDILYTGHTDGFVLMSSDSDFTRLALRLREAGKYVIGIGERKTPQPFIVACDKFIYIENIRERAQAAIKPVDEPDLKKRESEQTTVEELNRKKNIPKKVIDTIAESIADIAEDDGFASLGHLGQLLNKKQPDFDPRSFGFSKLSMMMKSLPRFEIDERPSATDTRSKIFYVRDLKI